MPVLDGNDAQDKTRNQKIADYAQSRGWTRAADGGWNTNPGGSGWASNEKVGEEMDYVNSGRGNVQPLTLGSGPSEIKAYEPSWTERIESSVQSGLMSLGMDKYQALQWGEKVGTLAGFVPGVGSGLSGNESYRAYASGHPVLGTIHAVGALPLPGAGKLAEKLGVKAVERAAEKAAIRETEERTIETVTVSGSFRARITKPELLPGEGKIGTYGDLVQADAKGDNVTPHNIPSSNRMAKQGVSKKMALRSICNNLH